MSDPLFSALQATLGPRQSNRLMTLHTPLGTDVLLAERMVLEESVGPGDFLAMNAVLALEEELLTDVQRGARSAALQSLTGFRLSLTALSADGGLKLADLRGKPVRLDWITDVADKRCIHGLVTRFEMLGGDGGLARYALVVEPSLRMLAHQMDSWVFQSKTVLQIVDEVLGDYPGLKWRWSLADASVYAERSLCVQYEESGLAFMQRLLAEEGMFFWFEHAAVEGGDFGTHTLVIADHNALLPPHPGGSVRFTRSDAAVFKQDSLQDFDEACRMVPTEVVYGAWDYRTAKLVGAQMKTTSVTQPSELVHRDAPGAYTFENTAQGERLALRHLEALQLPAHRCEAMGTWRCAVVATVWHLHDHPAVDAGTQWVTLAIAHRARNNISAEQHTELSQRLGELPKLFEDEQEAAHLPELNAQAVKSKLLPGDNLTPLYQCRLIAQKMQFAVRAPLRGSKADALFDRPHVTGVQTAVVVGSDEPIHTDRDNRIKIQFHWQRGARASHRLNHPAGESNAPGTQSAGTWVRMASSAANVNGGDICVPRCGQEVVVCFIEGDIDRPLALSTVYSGRGTEDAQGNEVSGGPSKATGNAGAWFPGNTGGHAHGAVLSGFKTQSMDSSQVGQGGYNQLVFDDTPGRSRTMLGTTSQPSGGQHATWLNLGHLLHQIDNQRLASRGHGLELLTTAQGALRSGSGLHLSAYARAAGTGAQAHLMEAVEAVGQFKLAQELTERLITTAQKQQAGLPPVDVKTNRVGAPTADEPKPNNLPVAKELVAVMDSLKISDGAGSGDSVDGGRGATPAWGFPEILLSAPGGIAQFTPAHAVYTSGEGAVMVSQQDIHLNAQRNFAVAVSSGLSLYTYGKVPSTSKKPNVETGMQIHAASGKVSMRANDNQTTLRADQDLRISSTERGVKVSAPKNILLTAGGSAIRIEPGKITLTTLRAATFHASLHEFIGPTPSNDSLALQKPMDLLGCSTFTEYTAKGAQATALLDE